MNQSIFEAIQREIENIRRVCGVQHNSPKRWRDILAKQLGDITIRIEMGHPIQREVLQLVAAGIECLEDGSE